jgi:serine/threonine-protein kinase
VGDDELFEGKYRIGELLGQGGMGVVHAAVNVFSDADVAIKRIPREVVETHALRERLRRESKVLALVIHPNIVRLLDCGATKDGDLYIVMERVDGDPLRALLRRAAKKNGTLDLSLVLLMTAQIAEAMALAHRKGIYHRDLKPENIMICEGGHVKVLDFGLAKAPSTGPAPAPSPTNPANVIGTPKYMAPEQVRGLPVDGRTDIYALGVVLYEAISGHTPFDSEEDEGSTLTEIMGHHVFAEPRPLRELVLGCPDAVWNLVLRCLAKKPEDRFASMSDLVRALRRCNDEMRKAARRVPVERRADDFAAREVRVTEPMPESFQAGDVLPFARPSVSRSPRALREMRVTEPMPAPVQPRRTPPSREDPARALLGKGHTLQLPRGPISAVCNEEPDAKLDAVPSTSLRSPEDDQESGRDGGEGAARSGPGFAFEPTWPEAQVRIEHATAVEARPLKPTPTALPHVAPIPTVPTAIEKTPRMKTLLPNWVALPAGLVLASFALVATMIVRSPRYAAASPMAAAPSVEPQPSASMSAAEPAPLVPDLAASVSAPEPVAWASASASAPEPIAVVATAAPAPSARPPSKNPPRPAQHPAPPAAPKPKFVPLFGLPSEKTSATPRSTSGVMK